MKKFHIFKDHIDDELKVLRTKAKEVSIPLSKESLDISQELIDYVELSKDKKQAKKLDIRQAYGIAAPQIGKSLRMFYISVPSSYNDFNVENDSKEETKLLLVNPILVKYHNIFGAFSSGESCLSVDKDVPGIVSRPVSIEIKAYNLISKKQETIKAKGRMAIILLHELDHLDGILYYDRIDKKNVNELDYKY